ncbi:DUF2911 domain-containing protein [Sphingobacteriaceae bacterium WQ 2009]|uniref:DUF2911 domain-containing protein n=1 Tax=Rhinopithecimicrobium faecis TaxID=2820698 RepID=A0A8T4H5R4_9SPHI|nr:DUF2911 domain-containing protein [Sphingobacteriaceae bacterium WQ 2009]
MKRQLLSLLTLSALSWSLWSTADAQVKLPPASSSQKIVQSVGIKNISLSYNRPNGNGRQVFGGLIPYNEVWRTGANNIPALTFEENVTIAGKPVPAGTYGILTIPGTKTWTVILSKNAQQWGAYKYAESEDLLRFQVTAETLSQAVETFQMSFDNVTDTSVELALAWDKTKVKFPIVVDQKAAIAASLKEAMQGEKKPYFAGAQYYLKNNLDINQALAWINEAQKENPKAPHIAYWKAKIQLKAGDKSGAKATALQGKNLAQEAKNPEYVKLNEQVLAEASK